MTPSNKVVCKSLFFVAILINALSANAAVSMTEGNSSDFWSKHSVVYATILEVSDAGKGCVIKLSVEATLSGSFDAAFNPTPSVTVRNTGMGYSVISVPDPQSKAVVVLEEKGDSYVVPSVLCKFMPYSFPIWKVENFSDKEVVEVRNRLIALRAEIKKRVDSHKKKVE